MTRATIRIVNRTPWRTDHLRAFVVQARAMVFEKDERKPLAVFFERSRTVLHGRAAVGGSRSRVWLPCVRTPDRLTLAQLIAHELAHNAGARGERWMRRRAAFGVGDRGDAERFAWAYTLPLERTPAPAPAPESERIASALAGIEARAARWQSKAKRAATALKKLARSRRYYTAKLAACGTTKRGGAS